jgi:hypothetical protein
VSDAKFFRAFAIAEAYRTTKPKSAPPTSSAAQQAPTTESFAAGSTEPSGTQAAYDDTPHGMNEQEYFAGKSALATVDDPGMYAMSEQDVNREVLFAELLPQGSGGWESGDDEPGDDVEPEYLEEDEPVGPTLEDHPVLLEQSTERQLCTTCFSIVLPDRHNLCPACECRDSLVSSTSRLAVKLWPCRIVNGNRIIPPSLRAAINGMVATRLMKRMTDGGTLQAGIPGLHQHRLVGIHTEDSFIYSEIGSSTGPPGMTDAAAHAFASMAAPVDTTAAASLDVREVVDYEEEADYGDHASPVIKADAASMFSPPASTLGGSDAGFDVTPLPSNEGFYVN